MKDSKRYRKGKHEKEAGREIQIERKSEYGKEKDRLGHGKRE